MNTIETETLSEEEKSEEEPCSPAHQTTPSPNQWEIIASRCLPQVTTKGGYMLLVKAIEAMRANGIVDRFSSVPQMAIFLTDVLGWEVKYRLIIKARDRLLGKSNEWEKKEDYLYLLGIFAEEKKKLTDEEITRKEILQIIETKHRDGLNKTEILAEIGKFFVKKYECTQMYPTFDF